jgi:hypothetical protein
MKRSAFAELLALTRRNLGPRALAYASCRLMELPLSADIAGANLPFGSQFSEPPDSAGSCSDYLGALLLDLKPCQMPQRLRCALDSPLDSVRVADFRRTGDFSDAVDMAAACRH